jgi:hypothetical protein
VLSGVSVYDEGSGPAPQPKPGDISVCVYCKTALKFQVAAGGLALVEMTAMEQAELLADPDPRLLPIKLTMARGILERDLAGFPIRDPPPKYPGLGRCKARTLRGTRCSRTIDRYWDRDRLCTQHYNMAARKRQKRQREAMAAKEARTADRLARKRSKPPSPAQDHTAALEQARLEGIEEANRRAAELAEKTRLHKAAMAAAAAEKAARKAAEEEGRRLQWVARQRAKRKNP